MSRSDSTKLRESEKEGWRRDDKAGPRFFTDFDAITAVRLSDGAMIEGDKMPKLKFATAWNWSEQTHSERQALVAEEALKVMESVVTRKLGMKDAAVLMQRVVQDQELDGMLLWRLMLVGFTTRSRLASKPGIPKSQSKSRVLSDEGQLYLECLLSQEPSDTKVARKMEIKGEPISRQAVAKRRAKKFAT